MFKGQYREICKLINLEWKKLNQPSFSDISAIALKFKVSKDVVRDCLGLKDHYDLIEDDSD